MALYCLNLREPLGPINDEPFGPFRILAGILGTFCCYGEVLHVDGPQLPDLI